MRFKNIGSAFIMKAYSGFSLGVFFMLIALSGQVLAQTGSIRGEINDIDGEALIGATVSVKGTTIGVSTDIDGRYILRKVPTGQVTLLFRYIGYESKEELVTVVEGETIVKNMQLSSAVIEGEVIEVTAIQKGQARALTEQRKSVNIKNVISAEQIEAFADNTVTDALSRIPGMGHGGANIRGVGAGASVVTMDGQRMGSTGGDRSVDLSTISADLVQDLEVIKVITPNMDASALAGVININTRRAIGGGKDVNIRVGGGAQDRFIRYAGPQQRASISYGDSPTEKFSFGVNLSYQRDPSSQEALRTEWGSRSFQSENDENRDILTDVGTELNFDVRERYSSGLQLTFQPNEKSTYHVQGVFNVQDRSRKQYGVNYNPRVENYTTPTQTGYPNGGGGANAANQSTIGYNPRLDESKTQQYTIQAGGRHRLDALDLEYSLGWGYGRSNEDQYRMGFETLSRHEFIFNFDDRLRPTVKVAPWSLVPNYPLQSQMIFDAMDHRISSNVDNDYQGKIDLVIPIPSGNIKTGLSSSLTFKRGNEERLLREYSSRLDVSNFQLIENGAWQVFDNNNTSFGIPWLIDLEKARDFYIAQTPRFETDLEEQALSLETSKYSAGENTYAAYAMTELSYSTIRLIGGARVEHTTNEYVGREGDISESGRFLGAQDINSSNAYTNFFPNAQIIFSLSSFTNLRLAYSRSIGRPTFNQLSPNILRDYSNQTISQGNPDLKPLLSNNYDFLFEHYFENIGQITAGLFYKDLRDFVFQYSERIQGIEGDEEFAGWRRSGFRNGDKATVYGFEFSWQQNLEFLPGFLGNLGTYFNYSYSQSIANLGRTFEQTEHGLGKLLEFLGRDISDDYKYITPLSGQRPQVVNVGLDYSQGDFFTQLSYQWSAASISSYGSNDRQWVALENRPVYFDLFNDATQNLSLTTRYWLSPNFQIWFDASNILNEQEVNYYYNRDAYPARSRLRGRELSLGIRYRL